MPPPPVKRVVLGAGASRHALTHGILQRLPGIQVVSNGMEPPKPTGSLSGTGKETLTLTPYKGAFLKPCPGTRDYICCGYQILNVATNCPLDCSYCILQTYFNEPDLKVFVNLEEGLDQVFQEVDRHPEKIFRIGTGEFTDSLALDPITRLSGRLLPHFSGRKNVILELKTKTANVGTLIRSEQRDRIVVSWSLNSLHIASREEQGSASIEKRIKAAQRCQAEGFVVAFHFDPLIPHPGWEPAYLRVLELMDKHLRPEGIIWISLGSFRFMPELKSIIRQRHPQTGVLDGEFIRGLDGKFRYFKPIRIALYRFIRENLEKWHPNLGLYLCMESDEVWEKGMGWSPKDSPGLCRFLDGRVLEFFG